MEKDETKGNRKLEHKNQWFIFNAVAVVSAIVYCSFFWWNVKMWFNFHHVCVSVLMIGLILEMCDNFLCSVNGKPNADARIK